MGKAIAFVIVLLTCLFSLPCEAYRTPIAIIDTGLNLSDPRFKDVLCETGHRDYTGEGMVDYLGHGTHVSGLIKQYARNANYCLVIIKYYSVRKSDFQNLYSLILALEEVARKRYRVVNYSGGGDVFSPREFNAVKYNPSTLYFVAAGNKGKTLTYHAFYPASYNLNNVIVVGSIDTKRNVSTFSNYGNKVNLWEVGEEVLSTLPDGRMGLMSGSSQSTAIATGKYIYANYR